MFGRNKRTPETTASLHDAHAALLQSKEEYALVQLLKPEVEKTVKGHFQLLTDNHFSERIWLAYRGES